MEDSNKITEPELQNEGLKNVAVNSTGNNELITAESVARQITERPVEGVDTE